MFLLVLQSDIGNQSTNAVDVVSQNDTTDGFNKNHQASFLVTGRHDITKTNCKHNSSTPVIRPNILLIPSGVFYSFFDQPIICLIDFTNTKQNNRENMCV